MMIDTHCHLDIEDYENVEEIINHMKGNFMIASGCNLKTNKRVIELINKYDNIFGSIGIHPTELDENLEESFNFIKENIDNKKVVAIGEIGLDYHYGDEQKQLQKEVFIKQINFAKEYNKTIVIHSRDAAKDTLDILKEHLDGNKAVLHCYGYSREMAAEFKKMNIKFGVGGVVTFKNSNKLKETVDYLSMDDILLETDSPYLSPEPFRGKKNEPYNIIYVAEEIAKIKGITKEEVLRKTFENAKNEFDLNI